MSTLKHLVLPTGRLSGWMLFLALPFAAIGVILIGLMASMFITWHNAQSWTEVPAQILHAELKEHRGSTSRSRATTYKATAMYSYEYNGQQYTSQQVGLFNVIDNIGNYHKDAHRELSQYQKKNHPYRLMNLG